MGEDEAYVWESRHTSTVPKIDGTVDPVWQTAQPLLVTVREAFGGHDPVAVELRASAETLEDRDPAFRARVAECRRRLGLRDCGLNHRVTTSP